MAKQFADFDFTPEPGQVEEIYSSGFEGVVRESMQSSAMFRGASETFYDAFPLAVGASDGLEYCLPIRAVQAVCGQDFNARRDESQRQGDCVGKMVKLQGMVDGCLDHIFGETDWPEDPNTGAGAQYCDENIYGERGHGGEGANCWRLWNTVTLEGSQGFIHRGKYGSYDLSKYSTIGGRWGRSGTPREVSEAAAKNPALKVFKVRSLQEAKDAVALGFGLGRCGSQGYSNRRNEDGLAERTTRWNHAIGVGGWVGDQRVLNKYGGEIWLYAHYWGDWNGGPKAYEQPDGSWFVRSAEMASRIASGECCAIGQVVGTNRKLVFERAMDRRETAIKEGFLKWASDKPK